MIHDTGAFIKTRSYYLMIHLSYIEKSKDCKVENKNVYVFNGNNYKSNRFPKQYKYLEHRIAVTNGVVYIEIHN